MDSIRPGDYIMFVRLTLADVARHVRARGWRVLLPNLLGWLSNWIIALAQKYIATGPQGQDDGFWEVIHSGIVVETGVGYLNLLESTCPRGLHARSIASRLADYPGAVFAMHLGDDAQAKYTHTGAARWCLDHECDRYRFGGLPFALVLSAFAWAWPGALFCSEAVASLLLYLGIIPNELPVLRGKRRAVAGFKPQCISPAELARLPQYQRRSLYNVKEAMGCSMR